MLSLRHTNEVIGAYVTVGARIHLYGFLDKLQEKAISTDTVIFIQPTKVPYLIKKGDNLGQIQSELKEDEIIVEYAYKTYNSGNGEFKTVRKVRGITLNYSASQLVNFSKIKEIILSKDDAETVIVHTENQIKRKKIDVGVNLISEPEDKTYRVSFLKRRRLNDNTSLPFRYITGT